jgi:hypothetical protein
MEKMKIKSFLFEFIVIAVIVLLVSAVIGYLYDLAVKGTGEFNWNESLRFALLFGIIFPLINAIDRWRKTGK